MFGFFKRKLDAVVDPPSQKQLGYAKRLGVVVTVQMSKREVSNAITEAENGPELTKLVRKWQALADGEGYLLALYSKGSKGITVDVLRVNDISVEKKVLKLFVESPIRIKDKHIGEHLEWDKSFDLSIDKLLYYEEMPKGFYDKGIPAYEKAIANGIKIAKRFA